MLKFIFSPFTEVMGVYGTIVFFTIFGSLIIIRMVMEDGRK